MLFADILLRNSKDLVQDMYFDLSVTFCRLGFLRDLVDTCVSRYMYDLFRLQAANIS